MCWDTAGIQWGSARNTTVPGGLPRLPKSCSAAREGETKFPNFPAGCLGHSTAEQMTMLTPLPLVCRDPGTSTCLLLDSGFFWTMPTWHLILGLIFPLPWQAHWVLPHSDGELCLCSAHFSAPQFQLLRSCTTVLTSSPLCLSFARGNSSLNSLLLWRRTRTAWSAAPPQSQHRQGQFGVSALTSQLGWAAVCDAGAHLWECETVQFQYLSQASWRIPGARGVFLPLPDW